MKLRKWIAAHPRAEVRVVSIYRPSETVAWKTTLQTLGLGDAARWKNIAVDAPADAKLVEALEMHGNSGDSFILDPSGCVIHSRLAAAIVPEVLTFALDHAERCRG